MIESKAFSRFEEERATFMTDMKAWTSWHLAICKLKLKEDVPSNFGTNFEESEGIKWPIYLYSKQ